MAIFCGASEMRDRRSQAEELQVGQVFRFQQGCHSFGTDLVPEQIQTLEVAKIL